MSTRPLILSPAVGLLMMLSVFTVHFIRPVAVIFHYPINFIGLIPILVGAAFSVLADREFHRKGLVTDSGRYLENSDILVTSGVYSISRNPAYLGLVLIIAGVALLVGSLSPWLVVAALPILLHHIYIKAEESRLAEHFGYRYDQYRLIVPRWIVPSRRLSD